MDVCDDTGENLTSQTDDNDVNVVTPPRPRVIYTDLDTFLNAIHTPFLECVDLAGISLVDTLRAEGGLDQDEEDEIRAETTSVSRARALWNALHRLPPRFFQEKCMPFLQQWYPHVLNGADFAWEENSDLGTRCLRHVMMKRLRLKRFADVFPTVGACTHNEYLKLTGRRGKWSQVFQLLETHSRKEGLRQAVLVQLAAIGVRPSRCFSKLMRNGFPCTCYSTPTKACEGQPVQCSTSPNDISPTESSGSSCEERMESSDSEESTGSSDMDQGRQPDNAATFISREEKVQYKAVLNRVNGALIDASLVEPLFRKIECVREEARSLTKKAPDEAAWEVEDSNRLVSLRDAAAKEVKRLKVVYHKVKRAKQACSESLAAAFRDSSLNVKLMARQYLLEKKSREAERFFKRAVNMVKSMPLTVHPRNRV